MTAPERSRLQRMDALGKANVVRCYRKDVKRDLEAGRRTFATVLLDDDPRLDSWKVFDVLLHVPKIGRIKANKALSACRVSPSKTVGGLTDRQRAELLRAVTRT